MRKILLSTAMLSCMAATAHAYDLGEYGQLTGQARYRFEYVSQDSADRDAYANTLRLKLGYQTPTFYNLSAFVEGESIQRIGNNFYDDGAVRRNPNYPQVSDPEDTALNQLYVNYKPVDMVEARIGRQILELGNGRWVSAIDWRQNDQTFDAANFKLTPMKDLDLQYAYVWNVNRTQGNEAANGEYKSQSHIIHATYALPYDLKATAYAYLLDMTENEDQGQSSQTYGARVDWAPKGNGWNPLAAIELADQKDYADNPANYDEIYQSYTLGGRYNDYKLAGTFESFGSDGTSRVNNPIGGNHSLNGYAERFGTKPVDGLQDYRLNFTAPLPAPAEGQTLKVAAEGHAFYADEGGDHYGNEVGGYVDYSPWKGHSFMLKSAYYHADTFSADTTKVYLQYNFKF